jgi:LmbE family N-acetylglucosaminyl deacetylase
MKRRRARQRPQEQTANASYTLVAFHAHPDDEALLTGGTLARCVEEGHRVVLVVATAGERGLAVDTDRLGERRLAELDAAACALGIDRTVTLGYGDSGFADPVTPPAGSFCDAAASEAADRLATILIEERADVLTIYDARGGYGHRDHLRVHTVGLAAARIAKTPVTLAATVDRTALQRAVRLLRLVGVHPGGTTAAALAHSFSSPEEITHIVDVKHWVVAKRSALAAHSSQARGDTELRPLRLLAWLPWPLSRCVLGTEWFVEISRNPTGQALDDIFATLRDRDSSLQSARHQAQGVK